MHCIKMYMKLNFALIQYKWTEFIKHSRDTQNIQGVMNTQKKVNYPKRVAYLMRTTATRAEWRLQALNHQ